jgi:hypothetical protein
VKAFLLLVTIATPGQPTTNYQVTFSSPEACDTARLQVINDAKRVRQGNIESAARNGLPGEFAGMMAASSPSVSAVCVAQ